jgi:hypothetical protein
MAQRRDTRRCSRPRARTTTSTRWRLTRGFLEAPERDLRAALVEVDLA